MSDKQVIVLGLSGGLNSSTLLFHLLEQERNEIHIFSFLYEATNQTYEIDAVQDILDCALGRETKGKIKEAHLIDIMRICKTFPKMNQSKPPIPIFISIMAVYAESMGGGHVALGVGIVSSNKVTVMTPFIGKPKSDIVSIGKESLLNVPWELTRTCSKDQELACGTCTKCVERLGAFIDIGMIDPIDYMDIASSDLPFQCEH